MLPAEIKILFVAGFGPVSHDNDATLALYRDVMALPLKPFNNSPYHIVDEGAVDGVRHFAVWPLAMAAQSCFRSDIWPDDIPIPQAWLEFDVENLDLATACLKKHGISLLVDNHEEPWGQRVTRFLDPQGMLVAITYTPWLRSEVRAYP